MSARQDPRSLYTATPEGRARYTAIQRTWTTFDRATAYMCAQRGEPFDQARMDAAWAAHEAQMEDTLAWMQAEDARLDALGVPR